ncbi:MAG: Sec-independent protein translocase protein TatB [Sulfurospirillaceae bacterium]|nr:Sec-independent protein translocase protein TatB [Sulfurospirillaceae bacterium]
MFGMGFSELLMIAIVAVLFLGPDKLPDAMVQVAKFFKTFKKSINEAKSSIEQEMHIQELKEEALEYKKKLEAAATSTKKQLSFDELEDIKNSTKGLSDSLKEMKEDAVKSKKLAKEQINTEKKIENNDTKEDV